MSDDSKQATATTGGHPPVTAAEPDGQRSAVRWKPMALIVALLAIAGTIAVGPRFHRAFALLNSGQQVDIGGRELFIRCQGSGDPTVLLEHGLGSSGLEWETVQEGLAGDGRVCFTSRAGMGFSDPVGDQVRTAQDAVDDLSAALAEAEIAGPYVLVGHSFGGFVMRLYADQHPDDVVAMVLIDSTSEDQVPLLREGLTSESWSEIGGLFASDNPERMDVEASAAQVAAAGRLGDLPLAVLQAGVQHTDPDQAGVSATTAAELDTLLATLWPELQADLADLSTNSTLTVVDGSGHFIHVDRPDVVIDTIRSLVDDARRAPSIPTATLPLRERSP